MDRRPALKLALWALLPDEVLLGSNSALFSELAQNFDLDPATLKWLVELAKLETTQLP